MTFESLVELILAKYNPQVVQGTGVKLHSENHIPTRTAEALVVALELQGDKRQPMKLKAGENPAKDDGTF